MLPQVSTSDVGVFTSATLGVLALVGLAVRFVLVPYLREHLVRPVQETHRQVTQNRHESREPTVVDRIDDVLGEVRRLADSTTATQSIANAALKSASGAHRRIDDHVAWAREEDNRLWSAVSDARHRAEEEREEPPHD